MLSNFQNKILNFSDYLTLDKIIDGLSIDNQSFNITKFDYNQQKTIKTKELSKLDDSFVLFDLYIKEKYPELQDYFNEINSKSEFNNLSESQESFLNRLESIKETKKTFFRIYDKVKIYRGTKSFFEFIISFYLKMKYSLTDASIEINIYETGAFNYLITANLDEKEFEYIIKPIVHPNGWNCFFVSQNQFADKVYYQDKIYKTQKLLDFNSVETMLYSDLENEKNRININFNQNAFLRDFQETLPQFFTLSEIVDKYDNTNNEKPKLYNFYCEFNINNNEILNSNQFELQFSEPVDINLLNKFIEIKKNNIKIETNLVKSNIKKFTSFKFFDLKEGNYTIKIPKDIYSMVTHQYLKNEINFSFSISESSIIYFAHKITPPPIHEDGNIFYFAKKIEPAPTDYVHHYEFLGNANDSVGNNNLVVNNLNYGTDRNGVVGKSAIIDSAFSTTLNISIPLNYPKISVSMWVNTTQTSWGTFLYCSSPAYYYPLVKDSEEVLGIFDTSMKGVSQIFLNQYCNLIYTQDGYNVNIYVNGILKGSIISTKSLSNYPINHIGYAVGEWATGKIEDIKVWNRILTDEEALQITNLG